MEKALGNLRKARLLTIRGIRRTPQSQLEQLIRPSGYFRQKAQRLKLFVDFLDARYSGSLTRMFARPTMELREELLALNGDVYKRQFVAIAAQGNVEEFADRALVVADENITCLLYTSRCV